MSEEKNGLCEDTATTAGKQEGTTEVAVKPESSTTNGGESLSELSKRIVEQVEFYFGDINLPRDRFLQDELKKDDGWVPLSTMIKFNRLAQMSTDVDVIAEALKHSKLIEVSDDKAKIRRDPKLALPENSLEYWQSIKHRTVYIKGFKVDSTLDEIQNFVKQFGEVDNVLMRREKGAERRFKGSVFVTFKTRDLSEQFVNNETKQYAGNDLIKMMQDEYWAMKQQQMKDRKMADRNAKLAKKAAQAEEQAAALTTAHFLKGMVLSVDGLPKEGMDVKKIKEFFKKFGDVAYVVFETGSEKAQIRFSGEEDAAKAAWKQAVETAEDGKVMIEGNELKGTVLEGEEEEKYWNEFNESKANKQSRLEQSRGRGRPRGRGRGRGRGRSGGRGNDAVARRKREGTNEGEGDTEVKKAKKTVFADEE
uniref:Lupus La protein n=2 Tax=Ascaris TaxID=6251 RepID=A0A0M3HTZ3_ASCLU